MVALRGGERGRMKIEAIDLDFMGAEGVTASFLLLGERTAALVETGPTTCLESLMRGLDERGVSPSDVRQVFLTHVHLDHAAAAGHVAGLLPNAVFYVYEIGRPHLADPRKQERGGVLDGVDRIQAAWERERPGTPAASIGVITRIWRVGKLLDDERRRTMGRLGMEAPTCDLLSTLRRAGAPYKLSPGEIARRTLVSAGAITQRVSRAEKEGLVRREKSGPDGRSVMVELTPAGRELIDRSVDELLRYEETLLSALTSEQREELSALLRILLTDLSRRFGAEDRP